MFKSIVIFYQISQLFYSLRNLLKKFHKQTFLLNFQMFQNNLRDGVFACVRQRKMNFICAETFQNFPGFTANFY